MRKSISLLVVLTLIISMFALVGNRIEEPVDEDVLDVSIVVSSAFGDKSFNDSAKAGGERLAADYGVNVNYIECNNDGIKQKLMDAAESSDFVVAVGWECYEVEELAPEYPDTRFIFVDNPVADIGNLTNLQSITYAQNEGSFLAGFIAAAMSETGVVGALGGEDSDTINDFMAGYIQGAQFANPDIKVEIVYADTYEDPALGRECAFELHDRGADIIFNVAGNTGNGIFAAARERGFYAIGVDCDQKLTSRENDRVIICSMKKDIGQSIYDTIADFIDSSAWNGGTIVDTNMATGYVSIAYGDENSRQFISDVLKKRVSDLADQIIAGDIEVNGAEDLQKAREAEAEAAVEAAAEVSEDAEKTDKDTESEE